MINNELLKRLSGNLVASPDDYMSSLRHNLLMYTYDKNITLHDISEDAQISFETLKSLVYGYSRDCKLSTVIALARALHVSVDELVGCGTIDPVVCQSMQICRNMPVSYVRFVRWAIRYHQKMLCENKATDKSINVMLPTVTNEGNIVLSNSFRLMDISNISEIIRPKIFMGVEMPCDNYMPRYGSGDILLIANDRSPMPSETVVIIVGGYMWLANRKIDTTESGDKIAGYYSIRDGQFRVSESNISQLIGYVTTSVSS